MNVEQVLSYVRQKGIVLIPDGNQIKYKAPSGIMTADLAGTIRNHKKAILGILTQARETEEAFYQSEKLKPGDCDRCPASGFWDFMGTGKWCFHRAYYLGKPGEPVSCDSAKANCPLN